MIVKRSKFMKVGTFDDILLSVPRRCGSLLGKEFASIHDATEMREPPPTSLGNSLS